MTDTPEAPQATENTEKIDVIVNRRSGTVLRLGEDVVQKGLEDSLSQRAGTIRFIEGRDIISSVKEWTETQAQAQAEARSRGEVAEKRGLIVGGGDGTVLTAAALFLDRKDITMGVLPLGTHNLFARQLGFAADFRSAAKQYKDVEASRVDVGNVNGENFLVGLMIDKNSVDFYKARELWRDKKVFKAAGKFLSTIFGILAGRRAKLNVDGNEHKGRMFLVTNNQITPRKNEGLPPLPTAEGLKPVIENILAKGDSDGLLGFYAFKGNAANLAAILPKMWDGTWTEAKSVKVVAAPELIIQPPGDAGTSRVPIVLDGEPKELTFPFKVKVLPLALPVYRPRTPVI